MTQAGPAFPCVTSTDAPSGGPALRIAIVNDGRAVQGGPAYRVVAVSDGRPTQGNEPIPVVIASGAQAANAQGGPPIPVVVVSGSLSSAPAFVKQTPLATAATASWNVPLTSTAGDLLVALIGVRSASTISISGITDTAGNTWVKANSAFHTGVNGRIEIWYAKNAGAVTSITITPSASVAMSVNVAEFSGVDLAAPLDKNATADNNAVTTFDSGTTAATAQASEVVIAAGAHTSANTETLDTAGFTPLTRAGAAANCVVIGAYRIVSATGAQRVTWTMNAATTGGGAIATFKGAS